MITQEYFWLNKTRITTIWLSLLISFTLFLWSKYNYSKPKEYIKTIDYSLLQEGDLVFRQGNGILSQALELRDKNSQFSHVGIVKIIDNLPLIIHASTGKPLGNNAIVKMESIEDFLQKDLASAVGVYRLDRANYNLRKNAANLAYQYSLKQVPFDADFSLQSEDKLYCTELVWRAYLEVGIDLVDNTFSQLSFPFNQELYLLPNSLLDSKHLKQIYQIQLKH